MSEPDTDSIVKRLTRFFGSQTALGNVVGVRYQNVQQWDAADRVPSEHVIPICKASGYVFTPHQLRPDLYPNPGDALPPGVCVPDSQATAAAANDAARAPVAAGA